MLAAVLGFQPGMYASPQVPPPRGPRAEIRFTAIGQRVTGFAVGVLNAPCRGPITRRHKSGFIGGGGPFSAPIDTHGRFNIRINGAHGGEVGTIRGRTCGVRKPQWTAVRGL